MWEVSRMKIKENRVKQAKMKFRRQKIKITSIQAKLLHRLNNWKGKEQTQLILNFKSIKKILKKFKVKKN